MTYYIIETPEGQRMKVDSLGGHDDCTVIAESEVEPIEFYEVVGGEIVPDLARYKELKREAVNALRNDKSSGDGATCMTSLGAVQCDEKSKTKISGLALMAFMAKVNVSPFQVNFTLLDNTILNLDADGMITLGKEVGNYDVQVHYHATDLKAQIDAAADLDALNAIDIEANWP